MVASASMVRLVEAMVPSWFLQVVVPLALGLVVGMDLSLVLPLRLCLVSRNGMEVNRSGSEGRKMIKIGR